MAGIDDDATLTQLAIAWVGQALVGAVPTSWGWHGWWSIGFVGMADTRFCEALARACRGILGGDEEWCVAAVLQRVAWGSAAWGPVALEREGARVHGSTRSIVAVRLDGTHGII